MKALLAILAGMCLMISRDNVHAQGARPRIDDENILYLFDDVRFGPHLLDGRESLSHVPLMEMMATEQGTVSGAPFRRPAQCSTGLRKRTADVYLPDTLILYSMLDTIRLTASYDPRGWNDQILAEVWSNGRWVNYSRQSWTYLDQNASNLTLEESWSNGQWTNVELDSSTYDARGNMLVHLFKHWSSGAWKDSILSSRTYDASGNILSNESWHMINNAWTHYDRFTYAYDSNENMLSSLLEDWIGGSWVYQNLVSNTYDASGHMLTSLRQSWNGQWDNASLSTYTYDPDGNMLSDLFQISASGQWTNSTIHTYTYDANGNMLTDWLKGWTNAAWMNGALYTYTYDANGNRVNALRQEWLNGAWTNYRQSTFTYDTHGDELTGNNTTWSGSSWVSTDYDFAIAFNGGTYDFIGYSIIVSYTLITTGVSKDNSGIAQSCSLFQNYPNPFNPNTEIRFRITDYSKVTLRVYDILGREVATLVNQRKAPGSYEVRFDATGLASGVYFYRLQAGDFVQTKRLLLLK